MQTMLEEKAKELGRLIGQSEEYKAVKRSNDALNGDREAVTLLRRMEELRVQAQQMIERGEQPGEDMERELDGLLQQVQANDTYMRAAVSQENFDKIMLRVNEWILEGIRKGASSPIITLG
jgi:cell fate (sporulation/competence/biofilm development) regulator YlbF (YheA/YmcA/DUF963 family)